jgi:hypothetical protein
VSGTLQPAPYGKIVPWRGRPERRLEAFQPRPGRGQAGHSRAGDGFNAGLITGLLRGLDLPRAAALGCAVGAASTQALGGTGSAPTLDEALLVAGHATIRAVEPRCPCLTCSG